MKSYPLLQSQLGVFYDCLKYPQVMQYNIPCIVPLTDDIDCDRLETAMQSIFAARKELRIRFFIDEKGEPRQFVDDNKKLTIVRREMTEADFHDYAHHGFCRPFDIMGDEPLIRVEIAAYDLSSTHQMRWIKADNDYTTQVLYRYGFQWPITARSYVHRFVDTIIGFDYLNVNERQ